MPPPTPAVRYPCGKCGVSYIAHHANEALGHRYQAQIEVEIQGLDDDKVTRFRSSTWAPQ